MFRFTIRDVLLLMVAAAFAAAWLQERNARLRVVESADRLGQYVERYGGYVDLHGDGSVTISNAAGLPVAGTSSEGSAGK
jgi:hypothetical protein